MGAAPPSDQLGALKWFAPPLLHVYPAPAQSFPDLKTTHLQRIWCERIQFCGEELVRGL